MLLVEELRELPIFENFRLIAGEKGLKRAVVSTTTLEYENFVNGYQAFHQGDLILPSFEALFDRGVAAIAVKTSFYHELPEEAVRFAEEKSLPLFLFGEDIYTENIIMAVGDVLEKKKSYQYYEQTLDRFLHPFSTKDVVDYARKFSDFAYGRYFIACLSPKDPSLDVENVFNRISYRTKEFKFEQQIRWIKYQNRMVLLYNFPAERKIDIFRAVAEQMQRIPERMEKYYCGVSELHTELLCFDIALNQALTACSVAALQDREFVRYEDVGIYQYLLPLLMDNTVMEQYHHTIHVLQKYDEQYHSDLFHTLRVFAKNQGKISATAEELFQHVNTVRYRLKRAQELLQTDRFYETVFLIMGLYELEPAVS
ncbi:MAG: helix-turn-helix domain-containing protein [Lachnospiraceae bacterium]|nr:helix-turn-helix domain-containing protein [Lachnospiraceae bacterium]